MFVGDAPTPGCLDGCLPQSVMPPHPVPRASGRGQPRPLPQRGVVLHTECVCLATPLAFMFIKGILAMGLEHRWPRWCRSRPSRKRSGATTTARSRRPSAGQSTLTTWVLPDVPPLPDFPGVCDCFVHHGHCNHHVGMVPPRQNRRPPRNLRPPLRAAPGPRALDSGVGRRGMQRRTTHRHCSAVGRGPTERELPAPAPVPRPSSPRTDVNRLSSLLGPSALPPPPPPCLGSAFLVPPPAFPPWHRAHCGTSSNNDDRWLRSRRTIRSPTRAAPATAWGSTSSPISPKPSSPPASTRTAPPLPAAP